MYKKLTLWLDDDFIRKLKKLAIDEGTSLSQLIHKVLSEYMKRK